MKKSPVANSVYN